MVVLTVSALIKNVGNGRGSVSNSMSFILIVWNNPDQIGVAYSQAFEYQCIFWLGFGQLEAVTYASFEFKVYVWFTRWILQTLTDLVH